MLCPNCGQMNDDFQTVCLNCGELLTPGFVMCPECGKVLRQGDTICPRCKASLIEKTIVKNNKLEHVAVTPKYVVKAPLTVLTSLSIMLYFAYSFIYNIVVFTLRYNSIYTESSIKDIIILMVSIEIRPLILFFLLLLSIFTFIFRIAINRSSTREELEKRFVRLKCFMLADVTAFFTYFLVSFWPSIFTHDTLMYYFGGGLGLLCLLISLISLPLFYKHARIRTR